MNFFSYKIRKYYLTKFYFKHDSPILVNSIPKSGTHLLGNIIKSIPNTKYKGDVTSAETIENPDDRLIFLQSRMENLNPGSVYLGHVPYSENTAKWLSSNKIKHIFVYRDPRDVVVSMYHYISRNNYMKHRNFNIFENKSPEEKLLITIKGYGEGMFRFVLNDNSLPSVRLFYSSYKDWLSYKNTHTCRFEDLTSSSTTIDLEIKKILYYLNFNKINEIKMLPYIREIGINPDKSPTFRLGKSGDWKNVFTQKHISLFNEIFDKDLLHFYGYE